ncbi:MULTISPECIES: hemerythrin domain-containing protein [unclassified Streptomyces]|uniref:hemerythrin domain-containing protein n=1 Tax=unclassified Streptomyces TaxID=2593676 RepID=UPI00380E5136
MINSAAEPMAVIETRLAHQVHRAATTLLAEAALRPSAPLDTLAQLRDFLVVNLRHHHETEDEELWPQIVATAPAAAEGLKGLSEEHERLEDDLDRLAAVALTEDHAGAGARAELHEAAVAVRDTVHSHLDHEEPILFPALRAHVTPEYWAELSQRVIATAPPVAAHLMFGFIDEVGAPGEVEAMMAVLPEPLRPLVPAMRRQADADLASLRGSAA